MISDSIAAWPQEGLERVGQCPVCGSRLAEQLHEGLTDRVFRCAPGVWTLYRCQECRCGYLNPRPTPATIGLAYSRYFTHEPPEEGPLHGLRYLRRAMSNGYRNRRWGTAHEPASWLGGLLMPFFPGKRAWLDSEMRGLTRATAGERLLDVGCGNGLFLRMAKALGWEAVGVDFDPLAVDAARSAGLDARKGNIEVVDPDRDQFDGITLSHVIEHVHDPNALLAACYRLLKPGGWIWVETPNLDAIGHGIYGRDWRDLDPPRHLVLFTRKCLAESLEQAAFVGVCDQRYRPLTETIFGASERIRRGMDPWVSARLPKGTRRMITRAEARARVDVGCREFITLKAWKRCSPA